MVTKIQKLNCDQSVFAPCAICLDPMSSYENYMIQNRLGYIDHLFEKQCMCKVYAHNLCIINWYKHRLVCPYCKSTVLYHRPSQKIKENFIWFSHKCMTCLTIYTCIETCLYFYEDQINSQIFQFFTSTSTVEYDDIYGNISQLKIE